MKAPFTYRQRLRYRFDNSLARGIWGILALLGVLAILLFAVIAFFLVITGVGPGGERTSFPEALWFALTRSLDPGTFSGDEGLSFRLTMLVVTLIGILLGAAIIGLVSSAIDRRLENLRRGRSLVVEEGHTLILGDSDKVIPVISELIEANASEKDRAVVVLTAEDTVEISDAIRSSIKDFKTTRLVVRPGQPTRLADLEQGNPSTAKSIIVLRSESDARVVKASLAALRCLDPQSPTRVIAELDDPDIARALASASDGRVIPVTSGEVVALIGAQVARAPGLGAIYEDLLDFDGDEFYVTPVTSSWVGKTFGQALLGSSRGTIMGLRTADGSTTVAPSLSTVLATGDALIGIAQDDSMFSLDTAPVEWSPTTARAWEPLAKERERTLLIGWSSLAPRMCREIDRHVAPGSEIHLLIDRPDEEVDAIRMATTLDNQALTIHVGDPVAQAAVHDALDAGPFNHVLLLSEHESFDRDEADARTLLALLHVHSHGANGRGPDNVVAELLDPNDVELTGSVDNRDFIVSQRLIALLMAQLSESPQLEPVFADVFDADGATIAMHPASRYVAPGPTTFRAIVEAAREWDAVAIGYRSAAALGRPGTIGQGLRLNPPKDDPVTLVDGDAILLIERPR